MEEGEKRTIHGVREEEELEEGLDDVLDDGEGNMLWSKERRESWKEGSTAVR
jgi:hypothetical protein